MGQKLVNLFAHTKKVGGLKATMRLAMKTFSENEAKQVPDTPENVKKMRDAIREITGAEAPLA